MDELPENDTAQAPAATPAEPAPPTDSSVEMAELPPHSRRLLKLCVPVRVTLASQRKSIQEITELGPGSIIKFDKTYEEPLELSVGDRLLARGDVVKVGEKFGLRIRDLVR